MTAPSPNKAFTLVEIMIVVAVIGVIVAIAMPAFLRAREVSRARGCQENLAKIDGAIDMYAIENKKHAGEPVDFASLVKDGTTGYLRDTPRCPGGGVYAVTVTDRAPTCSIGNNPAAAFAPHLINTAIPAIAQGN